jgi:3-dehydroquinate dehydratase-2
MIDKRRVVTRRSRRNGKASAANKAYQILVVNGPNLNLIGTREPDVYGKVTLDEIKKMMAGLARELGAELKFVQSNHEGELVDYIQGAKKDGIKGIIINPAAFTHTSVAIRDAVAAVELPTVEIHLSNIYAREEFRHKSLIAPVCAGQVAGFGGNSYLLGLRALVSILKS